MTRGQASRTNLVLLLASLLLFLHPGSADGVNRDAGAVRYSLNEDKADGIHSPEGAQLMAASPPPDQAVRLIFAYDSSGIRLVSETPVDLAVPTAELVSGEAAEARFWVEVRDAQGTVLHRVDMRNPIQGFPEVFSEQPGQTILRIEDPAPAGAFTVVVPILPNSARVVLLSSGANGTEALPERASTGAREIAEFDLHLPTDEKGGDA